MISQILNKMNIQTPVRFHSYFCLLTVPFSILVYEIYLKRIKSYVRSLMSELISENQVHTCSNYQTLDSPEHMKSSKSTETDHEADFLYVKHYTEQNLNFLKTLTVSDSCFDDNSVVLDEKMNIGSVLDEMHLSKTTCALLYANDDSLIGVLDTPDVIRYFLRYSSAMSSSARRLIRQCIVAEKTSSLSDICKHLCTGIRYIAVESNESLPRNHKIISQKAMVKVIVDAAKCDSCLSELLNQKNVCDIKPYGWDIISCSHHKSARDAFQIMAAYGITSLPIVTSDKKMIGVISATDVLYARKDISFLDKDVCVFVKESREDADNSRKVNSIVSAHNEETLINILKLMMHESVHHVYIVKDDFPVNVVSFVDILRVLCESM